MVNSPSIKLYGHIEPEKTKIGKKEKIEKLDKIEVKEPKKSRNKCNENEIFKKSKR